MTVTVLGFLLLILFLNRYQSIVSYPKLKLNSLHFSVRILVPEKPIPHRPMAIN